MASKSTNSTIFTVAFVGIAVFIAWKVFGKKTGQASTSPSYEGVSGGYQAPESDSQDSGLGGLLNSLLGVLGKGSGSGSGSGGSKNQASSGPASGNSDILDLTTPLGEALSGYDSVNGESFSDEAGNILDGGAGLDYLDQSILSSSAGQLPFDDVNTQFPIQGNYITSANDGSANDYSGNDGLDTASALTSDYANNNIFPTNAGDSGGDDGGGDDD